MKIAFFTQNLGEYISGGRQYCWHVAHCLAAKDNKVLLISNSIPLFDREYKDFPGRNNVEIIVDHQYCIKNREHIKKMRECDVFICAPSESLDVGTTQAIVLKKPSICLLLEPANMIMNAYNSGIELPVYNDAEQVFKEMSIATHRTVGIICSNQYCVEQTKDWLPRYQKDKIVSVYNTFNTKIADTVPIVPFDERENSIVFCSRTVPYKGYGDMAYIVSQMKERPKIYFITGFRDRMDLKQMKFFVDCEKAGLNIELKEKITEKEKFQIIARSKMLFFPSKFEGFGLPPAEALYVRTPVVCYDLPVLVEIYKQYLHYIPIGDINYGISLMNDLIKNNDLLFKEIEDAQKHVKSFVNFESYCDRLNDAVHYIMGKRNEIKKQESKPIIIENKEIKKEEIIKSELAVFILGNDKCICYDSLKDQEFKNFKCNLVDDIGEINFNDIKEKYVAICDGNIKLRNYAFKKIMFKLVNEEDCEMIYGNYKRSEKVIGLPDFYEDALFINPGYIRGIIGGKKECFIGKISENWEFDIVWNAKNRKWKNCREILFDTDWGSGYGNFMINNKINNILKEYSLDNNFYVKRIKEDKDEMICNQFKYKALCIVLFRDHRHIYDCLNSLFASENLIGDVVVGMHDEKNENEDLFNKVKDMYGSKLKGIDTLSIPFNFCKMNDMLIKKYLDDSYTHIILINDDVIFNKDSINNIIAGFNYKWKDVGIVGAKLLFPTYKKEFPENWLDRKDIKAQHCGVELLSDKYCTHLNLNRSHTKVASNFLKLVDAVTFAFVAIDVECYDSVKFDIKLHNDFNDIDFCVRAKKKGWNIVYNPLSIALHYCTATRSFYNLEKEPKNQKRFFEKHKELLKNKKTYQELRSIEMLGY